MLVRIGYRVFRSESVTGFAIRKAPQGKAHVDVYLRDSADPWDSFYGAEAEAFLEFFSNEWTDLTPAKQEGS